MSSATRVWRETIQRAAPVLEVSPDAGIPAAALELHDPELTSLVRQLFFTSDHRTRIFFAAVDRDSAISDLCERLGRIIATDGNTNVAVVHGAAFQSRVADLANDVSKLPERTSATHLAENLWRVPFGVFEAESENATAENAPLASFHYSILGAYIGDFAAPPFCRSCDGAVLVVNANYTRREAALQAKETLLNWNVELLGAVVVNRAFPVPEAIYRRL